jgi:hypothetical protein
VILSAKQHFRGDFQSLASEHPDQPKVAVVFRKRVFPLHMWSRRRIPRPRFRISTSNLASLEKHGKMMTVTHGRSRYTRGCRCNICVTAERQYQRDRYRRRHALPVDPPDPPKLNVVDSRPVSSYDGSVVAAVRDELNAAPAAAERPGLTAVALALAAILDDPQHVAVQPAAARQLVAILGTLSKRTQRRGKLAVVREMADTGAR